MSWKTPIGTARLNIALRRHEDAQEHARLMARIALETSDIPIRVTSNRPAGDERTLRGIPAIGRSVSGAIPGTAPGHH